MREKDTVNLKPRAWVRLKKGVYRDDLAQVDFVDTAQNSVHLRLIPRCLASNFPSDLHTSLRLPHQLFNFRYVFISITGSIFNGREAP